MSSPVVQPLPPSQESFLTADTLFLSSTNDIAVVEQSGVSNIIGPDVPVDVRRRHTGARV